MTQSMRKVIVVDDQAVVRRSVVRSLRLAGLEVRDFASAEELLNAPSEWQADCFLFDVHLTGMSGPNLYKALRSKGVHTPVVFMTADASAFGPGAIPEPGVAACLLKPFDRTILLQAIDHAMSLDRQAQDQSSSNESTAAEAKRSVQDDS
jgi:two-component system response regulator FixJ